MQPHFGTKADPFADSLGFPLRPGPAVAAILKGPRDGTGERIVRYVLEAFERPEVRKRGVAILRAVVGGKVTSPAIARFLMRELMPRIAGALDADDAELRASLAASQVGGMLVARYIVKAPGIATASVDELVARIGPTVQGYLYD